jgi:hypothetical protein
MIKSEKNADTLIREVLTFSYKWLLPEHSPLYSQYRLNQIIFFMKKYYLFAGLVLLAASPGFAQTKIGAAGAPDGSAMLEVTSGTSGNKGLLLPRMTLTQRNAIPAPATGLMIYNTTANQVQVNTGTPAAPIWVIATAANSGWDLVGNSGTNPTNNFIGTTDNQPLSIRTNNTEKMRVTAAGYVGVGTTAPIAKLNVVDTGNTSIVVGSSTGDMMSVSLGNGHHGMSRNLTNAGGGANDVALFTTSGSPTSPASIHLGVRANITDTLDLAQFVLKQTGNVGIGTNDPLAKLHVQGTARIATATGTPTTVTGRNAAGDVGNVTLGSGLSLTGGVLNTIADNADWNLIGNTGTNPATNFIGTGDAQPLVIRTSNVEQLRITAAGDVGIGTTAPAQSLHVQGTARIATAVGTPTTVTGRNAAGDVGNVTLGSGLALTGGVLNTTADNADWNLIGNTGTNPATNFIGTGDAQPLVIRTNNAEKLRVTAAGNVGIGIASPAFTLDVNGSIKANNDVLPASNSGSAMVWSSVNSGQGATELVNYKGTGGGGFRFYSLAPGVVPAAGVGELMHITGTGNVGIGTATPAAKLDVNGTARIATATGTPTTITGRSAAGDVGNVALGSGLSLTGGVLNTIADNADWNLIGNTGTNPATNFIGTGDAQPLVIRTSNVEQLRVTAAGDVGIGTTAPAQSLHVQGTARIATAVGTPTTVTGRNAAGDVGNVTLGSGLSLTGGVLNTIADNADWNLIGNTGTNPATNFIGTGDAQPLVIRTNNAEKLRVTAAGNVGIGTASPAFTLDVNGSIKANTDVLPASNGGSATVWNSVNSGQGATELVNYKGTGGGGFQFYSLAPSVVPAAGVGELMRITGTGNVGIGTATPAAKLDVNGTARIATAVGTPTTVTGRNAAGDVGNVTLGSGLALTGGVLNTTADNADWNLIGNTGTNPATNFIGTGDAQPLVIRTSNVEQLRVTAAGDVGIGTTTPAQSLHVQGTARIATAVGTPTTVTGRNAAGDVGNVTLGFRVVTYRWCAEYHC